MAGDGANVAVSRSRAALLAVRRGLKATADDCRDAGRSMTMGDEKETFAGMPEIYPGRKLEIPKQG
jgi:hypothetical protein